VRDARDAPAGRQLHVVDQHPGDRVGQQLADGAVALPPHAQRVFRVEPPCRARRGGQLLDRYLQRARHLVEHGQRRVAGARLDVAPGGARQLREPRHLLLREPASFAQLAHVLAEPRRERVAHGNTIAKCQCIGNLVGLLAVAADARPGGFAMQLADIAALVTGGSRGLGASLAAELARRGARVVAVARDAAPLDAVVARIRQAGFEAHAVAADQGERDAIYPLVGAATALVGAIDLLVLNASTLGPVPLRELADTECEDFARVLEVNLLGPFRLTKAVVGSMVVRGSGLVVGVSSDAAVSGYPGWGPYGVSKAGLDHLLRTWAAELAGSGVRFLSLDPGEMDTRMHADAIPDADRTQLADPGVVAARIATLLESAELPPSGSRLELSRLESAA
jgi:NAD(P)-dependent dehydrogenase (short-subunit alcohol dehydrogenase family)